LEADRLLFLKSVDRPGTTRWDDISNQGHLDPCTPGLLARAPDLTVDWINMRGVFGAATKAPQ
jgi:hypothetical protein